MLQAGQLTRRVVLGCCFSALAVTTLIGVFKTPLWGDELRCHFPMVSAISWELVVDPHSAYSSAYPPLPFLLASLVYQLVPSLYAVRCLNWLVALSCALVFRKMLPHENPSRDFVLLLFVSNPYFLRASCTFYVTDFGLLFGLSALWVYFCSNTRYRHVAAYVLITMATLSMQWLLMLFVGVSLYELRLWRAGDLSSRRFAALAVLKVIAGLPVVALILVWRGLTHPEFSTHALHPSFESANIVLAVLGCLFLFYSIAGVRRLGWNHLVGILFLSPLLFVGRPALAKVQGPGLFSGFESGVLRLVEQFASIPYPALLLGLTLSGMVFCGLAFMVPKRGLGEVSFYTAAGLGSAYVASVMLSSGHIYIMVPFLLLMLQQELSQQPKTLFCLNFQWYCAGLGYLLYYILLKSHGTLL